jgi:signal transduction histidine kinase
MKTVFIGQRRCRCLLYLLIWFFSLAISGETQTNVNDSARVPLTDAEKAWVQRHPVVYWGVHPHWPPFSSFDEHGRASGINVELVELIAKQAGLKLKLVRTSSWTETLTNASTGEMHFIGGIARTERREQVYHLHFTEPYCNFPTAIITRKDSPFLTSLDDLTKSATLALPRNYASTKTILENYPDARIIRADTEEDCMLMVAANKADATVLNLASATYVTHTRGLTNLKISGFTDIDFFLTLGVHQDSPELASILEKALASIDKKEQEAIYAKYLLPETLQEFSWKVWRQRLIYSVFFAAVALTAVLFWNRRLAREIKQRKLAEKELRKAGGELEQQAAELNRHSREMASMNETLTTANKDLESFSYSVSHDLKSPLRRLRSFLEILEEDAGPSLNAPGRESLTIVNMEARKMTDLINDLLIYGRIGRADMRLKPLNLRPMIDEMIQNLEPELKDREVTWKIDPLPDVICDPGLMRQALTNLIDNAVKFTRGRKPARIEIGVLPAKPEDKEATFYIKDNGSGFDVQYAPSLFEPFQRLHSQEEFEGTGVGLANVQRIIRRHGGRVWAEGEPDKGATFYFTLKRAPQ